MTERLPLWTLVAPTLLVLLYGMLIFFALTDQPGFYDAMAMPLPNHGFMHVSWMGKTVAIWLVLLVAVGTRQAGFLLFALVGVITQQIGDTIAGRVTEVDVFVTNIGLALSAFSLAGIAACRCLVRKSQVS